MQAIYDLVATEFNAVNELILEQLQSQVSRVEDISQYLVNSGGKRIRPLVTLLVAGALSNDNNPRQIQLATAIEFLHTATLLHDDVVDMSTLRRGQATANANWGNASSVLVGDFVYSRAFQLIVAIGSLPVMKILSDTTAIIAEGEVQQLIEIGNLSLDEASYYEVIERKTAELFAGACQSAVVIAGGDTSQASAMRDFGKHLGLAFQITDDYLDYAGNTAELGKNVGDDLAEGKLTLPLIRALAVSKERSEEQHSALESIISNKDTGRIAEAIEIVQKTGALDYTQQAATRQCELAHESVATLEDSAYRQALANVTAFVSNRIS